MNENVKEILDELIENTIQYVIGLGAEGKERSAAIEDLEKLYKLRIEETKTTMDYLDKREKRESELSEQRKDRRLRAILETAGIALPLGLSAVWMVLGFKFEEIGTISSSTFKWMLQKLKMGKR